MSDRAKKIFLGICIVVPFALYCYYYYSTMLQNAPFRFADFESIVLRYGESRGEEADLENYFDSSTGRFIYLDQRDSLRIDTIRMRQDDLLYLHRKAAELGFWNLPEDMTHDRPEPAQDSVANADAAVRFILQYNYKEKSKTVTFDTDFEGNPKMKDAARSVIDEVRRVLSDARGR